MITLEQGVELVWHAFEDMVGGEIYVKKIPSMNIMDLARTVAPDAEIKEIGIRPGEKLHEQMIGIEDGLSTYEYDEHFKILPVINGWSDDEGRIKDGKKVAEEFVYDSSTNTQWMSRESLSSWLNKNQDKLAKI
jgi:FlaA1/EpsC-like NDP-sugar epimerase